MLLRCPRRALALVAVALAGPVSVSTVRAQERIGFRADFRPVLLAADGAALRFPAIELGDTVYPKTYWLEGALIGGTVVGLLGGALAGGFCADSDSGGKGPCWDNVLLGVGFGFATGGSLGALVGGQFRKGRPEREEDDPEE
jgi:hypothetical protein